MHPGNTPNTSSRRRNPLHRLLALLLRHQARSARRYNAAHHRPPFDRPAVTTRAPALWDPELYSGDSKWAATYHDPKGDKP